MSKTTKLEFPNASGELLTARLDVPIDQHPHAFAIFAHCFTCNKNLAAARNISRKLTSHGFAVLRFDFTGLGESEGDFADTNFSSNVEDLIKAADYLTEHYESPKLIIGHSLGGAASILAASKIKSIEAVATIGAPAEPVHVKHQFQSQVDKIKNKGIAEVFIAGRTFTIKDQFLKDLDSTNLATVTRKLKKALLVLHAPQDTIVGIDNAAQIYTNAFHPKSFVSLDGADHLLSDKEDAAYVGEVIGTWAKRYVSSSPPDKTIRSTYKVATRTGNKGFTTDIKAGKHYLTADEPSSVGGDDFGPDPYSLLLSSLGACTSMTMQMYARRKKWDLQEVEVHLNHSKDYVEDCNNAEDPKKKIDIIERVIHMTGDLDESQKERLMEIADRCPVHKTLHGTVAVKTSRA
ncbi:MAG: bifunctional alpha/beta hydrolase/OsmC family protein [Bacteroidota bacterium]